MLSNTYSANTLVAAAVLVVVALVARAMGRGWWAPAPFFALCWTAFVWVPLMLAPEYPVSPLAVLWVVAAVVAVVAGAWMAGGAEAGSTRYRRPPFNVSRTFLPRSLLLTVLALAVILGFLYFYAFLRALGFGLSDLFSLHSVIELAAQLARSRYQDPGMTAPSLLVQALLPFVFFSGAMAGVLLAYRARRRDYVWALVGILPSLTVTLVTTAKQPLLTGVFMLLGAWFCFRIYRFGSVAGFTGRQAVVAVFAAAVLGSAMIGAQVLRSGETVSAAVDHLKPSVAGHMAVFSSWLTTSSYKEASAVPGQYSFAGPLQLLGLAKREQGLYPTSVDLDDYRLNQSSNVYTAYRGLIEDFGFPGSLCILALAGYCSTRAYRLAQKGSLAGVGFLLPYYVWVMWSFVTSIFNYNTIIAAFVLFWALLLFPGPRGCFRSIEVWAQISLRQRKRAARIASRAEVGHHARQ